MIINYNVQKTYTDSLTIENTGNFGLRVLLTSGEEYYFATQTAMGRMAVLKLGPIFPDDEDSSLGEFSLTYYESDFNAKTIAKSVDQLVNDPKKKVLSIMEVGLEDVLGAIPNQARFIFRGED